MSEWLDAIAGSGLASALAWTAGALLLLLVVLVLIKIFRGLTFGTFVAGGRNRKARLAVMDAAAVDSQRRLVLVRRDDVEHLLLIGGAADIVVEQNIRLVPPQARNGYEDQQRMADNGAQPDDRERVQRLAATAQAEQRAAAPERGARALATPTNPASPASGESSGRPQPAAYRPAPTAAPASATASARPASPPVAAARPAVAASPTAVAPAREAPPLEANRQPAAASAPDIDDSLMEELEVTLERQMQRPDPAGRPAAPASQMRADPPLGRAPVDRSVSIEDEMSRLLGELSGKKN